MASSSADGMIVPGAQGWVTMRDAKGVRKTVPALVIDLEVEGMTTIVACPGSAVLSEAHEWVLPGDDTTAQKVYSVGATPVVFHRINVDSFLQMEPKKVDAQWAAADGHLTVTAPTLRAVKRIYWGEDVDAAQTETDAEESMIQRLRLENESLRHENLELKKLSKGKLFLGKEKVATFAINESDEEEPDSDEDTDMEGLAKLMQQFKKQGGMENVEEARGLSPR